MVIPKKQKDNYYELDFGIKLKVKVYSLQWHQETHFTQNVTCSLLCESASQIL